MTSQKHISGWWVVLGALIVVGISLAVVAHYCDGVAWMTISEFVGNLGPVATAISVAVAAWLGKKTLENSLRTIESNSEATNRDYWWKRMQWAIDYYMTKDDPTGQRRILGQEAINALARDGFAPKSDRLFTDAVIKPLIADAKATGYSDEPPQMAEGNDVVYDLTQSTTEPGADDAVLQNRG